MSAFAHHAATLLANGFSPLPLRRNRLPLHRGWQALRTTPMTPDAIASERWYGLGVMCGYGGLVAIDVDVDDHDVIAAVTRAVPKSNVAKCGRKGFTVFYRATAEIKNRKFKASGNPKPVVEILSAGNMTVLPPSWHPGARREYQWCTPGTLFTLTASELVPLDPEHIDALANALEPWCPRKVYQPAKTVDRELVDDRRMRAYARTSITNESTRLASLIDGRHTALFAAACALGRYCHHGIVAESEVYGALRSACSANGLATKRGPREIDQCIARGLGYSAGDSLPDLDSLPGARPRRLSWREQYEASLSQTVY